MAANLCCQFNPTGSRCFKCFEPTCIECEIKIPWIINEDNKDDIILSKIFHKYCYEKE